ncbi:MAG: carboxypeptidase-like regulatory domain-containing protein, partial [Bacteroidota bacterium]
MKHFLLMLFVVLWSTVTGQAQLIEGTILDEVSSTGIPYANIYNKTLDIGTISNEDGYFEIRIRSTSDVIEISFIGYEGQTIPLTKGQRTYTILLQEESQLLNEVTITPKDDSYLFNLLFEAKKVANFPNQEAKAYYELKTWRDQKQVELVENYYNLLLRGPDVSGFQLKAGRLALQEEEGRYFGSFGGSNAINLLKLWDRNDFFPNTPIDIAKRRAKRTFYLHLSKKYINADQDSIYVIDYEPQTSDGPYFTGQIWLNKSDMQVLKITQLCDACAVHPFIPLFPTDSLLSVNFDITKTFKSIDGKMVFNHIDFLYDVTYRSRIGYNWEDEFTVSTKAVLYAYDFEHQFYIPSFFLGNKYKGDYRKINGVPYNIFFWDYNDEYGLN